MSRLLRSDTTPTAVGAAGLAVLVIGTFLPWLRSGSHERNSYQAGGAVRRLLDTGGIVEHVLALWPFVGIACAVAVALHLVGLRVGAAVVAALTALAAGAAAVAALATGTTSVAQVIIIGPAITLAGATLIALAVALRAVVSAAVPRRT